MELKNEPLKLNLVHHNDVYLGTEAREKYEDMILRQSGFDPEKPMIRETTEGVLRVEQDPEHTLGGQVLNRIHIARREFLMKFAKAPDTVYLSRRLVNAVQKLPDFGVTGSGFTLKKIMGLKVVTVLEEDYVAVGLVYTE